MITYVFPVRGFLGIRSRLDTTYNNDRVGLVQNHVYYVIHTLQYFTRLLVTYSI